MYATFVLLSLKACFVVGCRMKKHAQLERAGVREIRPNVTRAGKWSARSFAKKVFRPHSFGEKVLFAVHTQAERTISTWPYLRAEPVPAAVPTVQSVACRMRHTMDRCMHSWTWVVLCFVWSGCSAVKSRSHRPGITTTNVALKQQQTRLLQD